MIVFLKMQAEALATLVTISKEEIAAGKGMTAEQALTLLKKGRK